MPPSYMQKNNFTKQKEAANYGNLSLGFLILKPELKNI